MRSFKFLSKNQSIDDRLRELHEQVLAYYTREVNPNYYTTLNTTRPIICAVADAINICNLSDIRYGNYEHYFHYDNRRFKLKVIEVRRYRNPIYSYWIIRYKMGRDIVNLDESMVTTQLRLDEEQYRALIYTN